MVNKILFFVIVIAVYSCSLSDKKNESSTIKVVNLQTSEQTKTFLLSLSELAKGISYVTMETQLNNLIAEPVFIVSGGYIFVQSRKKLFQFNLDGSFVNQIGRVGRGPGEFKCTSFDIDPFSERIYIFDYWQKKISQYSFKQQYLNSFNDPTKGTGITLHFYAKDTLIFMTNTNTVTPEILSFHLLTTTIGYIQRKTEEPEEFNLMLPNNKCIFRYNNKIGVSHLYNDTIYRIESGKLAPYLVVDRGENRPKPEYATIKNIKQTLGKVNIIHITETNQYIFIRYIKKIRSNQKSLLALYNKRTNKFYANIKIVNDIDKGFDIDGNSVLIPKEDNVLLLSIPAYIFCARDIPNSPRVNENSNPVLMEIQFK